MTLAMRVGLYEGVQRIVEYRGCVIIIGQVVRRGTEDSEKREG